MKLTREEPTKKKGDNRRNTMMHITMWTRVHVPNAKKWVTRYKAISLKIVCLLCLCASFVSDVCVRFVYFRVANKQNCERFVNKRFFRLHLSFYLLFVFLKWELTTFSNQQHRSYVFFLCWEIRKKFTFVDAVAHRNHF